MISFNDYQRESRKTAGYPPIGHGVIYPTLGLTNEAGEVAGSVGRQPDRQARRHDAIATLDAARPGVGVELGLQLVEACNRQRAVGGDVLPAIGHRAREIGRTHVVANERTGLEQI